MKFGPSGIPRQNHGVALVLVLAFLVLITALVLAFFSSVTTELSGAKNYSSGATTKQLADSTTQLVMGAITQATSNGTTVAWASQPGMIRTYSNAGTTGTFYKLYSSDTMVVTTGSYTPISDVPSTWSSTPALYTDLNAPVTTSSGTSAFAHYPILDGNNLTGTTAPLYSGSTAALTYNVSGTATTPDIEGFWVLTGSTGAQGARPTGNSIPLTGGTSGPNPVPMPVKWLYMLQSGSLVAPTASSGTTSQVTVAGATASNPIVGRIAFWTDDETCKINVNTASEGNFMDTPRTQGVTDFDLAYYPPFQNEYQRYPGHPAMTCLSSVLGFLFPVNHALSASGTAIGTTWGGTGAKYAPYQPYFDMNPKLNVDVSTNLGSQAGTVNTGTAPGTSTALTVRNDRLYGSVDEFLFQVPTTSGTRTANPPVATGTLTSALMDETRFFLTANSRAPDVNLFNQPRVLTWPVNVNSGTNYRTPYDQVFAFCGQIGMDSGSNALAYYFQRQRNDHPTNDLPGTASTTGLGRNRGLMNYLQNLTSQNIPGFGGNFGGSNGKYSTSGTSECNQILTEIFDYIRCLNLNDQSNAAMTHPFAPVASGANYTASGAGSYAGTTTTTSGSHSSTLTTYAGAGQVVPIYDTVNGTKGFGRFPTISEVSLIFIATGWDDGNGGQGTLVSGTLVKDINYQGMPQVTGTSNPTPAEALYVSPSGTAPVGFYNSSINSLTGTAATNFITNPPGPPLVTGTGPINPPYTTGTLNLKDAQIQVQAALLVNFFDPAQGNMPANGTYSLQISGLDTMSWGPNSSSTSLMGFLGAAGDTTNMASSNQSGQSGPNQYIVSWGGNLGFRKFITGLTTAQSGTSPSYYPFFSSPRNFGYTPPTTPGTMYFSGGTIVINMLLPANTPNWPPSGWPLTNSQTASRPPIQQITISFPSATLPVPTYAGFGYGNQYNSSGTVKEDRGNFARRLANCDYNNGVNAAFIAPTDVVRSVRAYPGDMRMIAGQLSINDTTSSGYFDSAENKISAGLSQWSYSGTSNLVHSLRESPDYPFYGALMGRLVPGINYAGLSVPFLQGNGTTVGSNGGGIGTYANAGNNPTANGAFIGGGLSGLPGDWDNGFGYTADGPYINKADEGNFGFIAYGTSGTNVPYFGASTYSSAIAGANLIYFSPNRMMPSPVMFGSLPTGVVENIPWKTLLFCPNPAAGNNHPGFGTPSTGSAGPAAMPPFTTPPDHLMLDLFTMPVVEPYPISEPLSTAGRINMNYQIAPFSYIERNTGLRAVLKAERMTVISDGTAVAPVYKGNGGGTTGFNINTSYDFRVPINSDETLKAFDNYFYTNNDIFRSASQICTMYMYPTKDSYASAAVPVWDNANANIGKFWNGTGSTTGYTVSVTPTAPTHYLTGDNSRERIYATIYPRLTTKSNTYTVHMRVQTLKKTPGSSPTVWTEGSDQVLSEYRGSQTIERYVDPADPKLVDFTDPANSAVALDAYYKFRVLNTKKFSP